MSKAEQAIKLHKKGYNCCQAVACVFADEVGLDESTLYKLGEGFGAGMGNAMGVCGAFSGAAMLAGLVNSDGNVNDPGKSKSATMKVTAKMQKDFTDRAQRLLCKDIKTGNNGKPFTSCDACIRIATEIVEETLGL